MVLPFQCIVMRGGKIIAVISREETQVRELADYCMEVPSTN